MGRNEKTKRKPKLWWLFAAGLLLLSVLVYFIASAYEFTALIGMGIAFTIACYLLLHRLTGKRPRLARALITGLTLALGLGIVAAAITGGLILKACSGQPEGDFTYLIVLGCGVDDDKPSLSLQNRINAAYACLSAHPEVTAVVSGGRDENDSLSEAQCMFNELTKMGIPAERIWMEDEATSTRENFAFSLALIEEKTGARPETVGVLSSEYHLYRAAMFARDQAVTACGIPAQTTKTSLFINYFLREIVMVWIYAIALA